MARSEITFIWSGVDRTGRSSKGEVNAPSVAIAKAQLRRQGINAKRLRKKTQPLLSMGKAIDARDIAVFTRQLATMTRAGVPMVQAIDIVMDGSEKPQMKELIRQIRNDVSGGAPVATSLGKHRKHFDDLYCSLIAAGENSGTLDEMLGKVADQYEMQVDNAVESISSLIEPMIMSVLGIIIGGLMIAMYLPIFMLGSVV